MLSFFLASFLLAQDTTSERTPTKVETFEVFGLRAHRWTGTKYECLGPLIPWIAPAEISRGQVEPNPPPSRTLNPNDPSSVAEHALQKTWSQKTIEASFTIRTSLQGAKEIESKGKQLWVSPGVLYLAYRYPGE